MDLQVTFNTNLEGNEENSYGVKTKELHNISEDCTFSELMKELKLKGDAVGLEKYYPNSCDFMDSCPNILPYLLIDDKYAWNINTLEAKLKDFCHTHSMVEEKGLFVTSKQVVDIENGIDYLQYILDLWNHYGDEISAALVLAGEIITKKELIKKLLHMFKENSLPAPCAVEEIILAREKWNHYELAEKLDIDPENAKMLLKGFGYKWSNHEMLYSRLDEDISEEEPKK